MHDARAHRTCCSFLCGDGVALRTYVSSAKELGWEEGWGPLGPAAPKQVTYLDTWALRIDDIAVCVELSCRALSLLCEILFVVQVTEGHVATQASEGQVPGLRPMWPPK